MNGEISHISEDFLDLDLEVSFPIYQDQIRRITKNWQLNCVYEVSHVQNSTFY